MAMERETDRVWVKFYWVEDQYRKETLQLFVSSIICCLCARMSHVALGAVWEHKFHDPRLIWKIFSKIIFVLSTRIKEI